MKVIIIDDERQARLALKEEVELIPSISLIGEANSIQSGIELIKTLKPDLVLLDIQVGDGMAFDLLEYFNSTGKLNFKVIITTAYSDYTLQAFKFSAIDYLLKPVDMEELKNAVDRIKSLEQSILKKSFQNFIYNHDHTDQNKTKRLAFHTSEGVRIEELDQIIRLNSVGNYTRIYFNDNTKLMISKPLKEYEQLLSGFHFHRIHVSHLINLHYFKSYSPKNKGKVTLKNGEVLPVSQRRRSGFLIELEKYSVQPGS